MIAIAAMIAWTITSKKQASNAADEADESDKAIEPEDHLETAPLVAALVIGPSSLCSAITLLIAKRKSIATELIIPVEALVTLFSVIVFWDSGLFSF